MGAVFAATDERLGRTVALKVLKQELSSDPRFVERFRREARSAAALSHPNIANVFDYGEDDDRHYIVMELVEGRDLARLIREDGPLDAARAKVIVAQIALGLGHAHAGGYVHRDVKPHNVIVTSDDRVKVTDFGIARATGESTLTATGTILGTAQYVSPEQASGETPVPSSDVYSLGIVLFEMVTGAVPFTGDSPISVALRHVREEVPAPSSIEPSVPPDVDELVARATAKQPDQRFQNGNAFAAAVMGRAEPAATAMMVSPTEPMSANGETSPWPFTTPPRWDPDRLGRTVLIVFGALFLIALAALGYRLSKTTEPIRERNRAAAEQGRQPAVEQPTTDTFTMPDYRGEPAEVAQAELGAEGIESILQPATCDEPEDYICDQSPEPGAAIEEGQAVTLEVSASEGHEDGEESDEESDEDPSEEAGKDKGTPEHAKGKKDKD